MHVINLWGAPSSGKSTTAAGLFFLMKINKFKVELVTEYAKDLSWEFLYYKRCLEARLNPANIVDKDKIYLKEESPSLQREQIQIFGEQNHRLKRLEGQIDFAISDSPLPLAVFYMPDTYFQDFPKVVLEQFRQYDNLNFFLHRQGEFETFGRIHDEEQANALSNKLRDFLVNNQIPFEEIDATPMTPNILMNKIYEKIKSKTLHFEVKEKNGLASFNIVEE